MVLYYIYSVVIVDVITGLELLFVSISSSRDRHVRTVFCLNWNSCTWSSCDAIGSQSDIIVQFEFSFIQELFRVYFKIKMRSLMVSKKAYPTFV